MTNHKARLDPHTPSLLIPAHYTYLVSYVFGHAFMPSINLDRARAYTQEHPVFRHPSWGFGLGKCSVCGANFNYGDLWKHELTGELITVGHDCADKYSLMADRSAFELEVGNFKAARAIEIAKAEKAENRANFFGAYPGLEAAFECPHTVVQDIRDRFEKWGDISDKQIALVLKIADQANKPKPVDTEAHVPAPEGCVTFQGVVVSVKEVDGQYGTQTKVTVKVETPEGSWLAWGTCPKAILDATQDGGPKGKTVAIKATLKHGQDAHFAFMARPTGTVVGVAV